ncbi:MAG: FHIPEP family type III secretion protein [Planctomycetes bacterium]|nr:FHIPEP family type III secretion protein [Planctomycetota bacterium]
MDYYSQLSRFLRRRICIDLAGRCTAWGTLASVASDHLRLVDTVILGDLEGHSWFEQIQYAQDGEGGGLRNPETIVRIDCVLHVTCVDDDIPEPADEGSTSTHDSDPISEEPSSDDRSAKGLRKETTTTSTSDSLATSLERLSTGLKVSNTPSPDSSEVDIVDDRLSVEIGVELVRLADPQRGGELLLRISASRQQIASKTGVVIPKVRIRDNIRLESAAYRILVNGNVIARGELRIDDYLVLNLDKMALPIDGVDTTDPAFGLNAKWIKPEQRERAELAGGVVCDAASVLTTHFVEAVKNRLHELVSCQDVLDRLEELKRQNPDAIDELVPGKVPIALLHRMLQHLLEERVAIINLMRIIESLAYHVELAANHDQLLQSLRVDIGRDICEPLTDENGQLQAIILDDETECEISRLVAEACDLSNTETLERIVESLQPTFESQVVLVQRPEIRRPLFDAIAHIRRDTFVIASGEVPRDLTVVPLDNHTASGKPTSQSLPPR